MAAVIPSSHILRPMPAPAAGAQTGPPPACLLGRPVNSREPPVAQSLPPSPPADVTAPDQEVLGIRPQRSPAGTRRPGPRDPTGRGVPFEDYRRAAGAELPLPTRGLPSPGIPPPSIRGPFRMGTCNRRAEHPPTSQDDLAPPVLIRPFPAGANREPLFALFGPIRASCLASRARGPAPGRDPSPPAVFGPVQAGRDWARSVRFLGRRAPPAGRAAPRHGRRTWRGSGPAEG